MPDAVMSLPMLPPQLKTCLSLRMFNHLKKKILTMEKIIHYIILIKVITNGTYATGALAQSKNEPSHQIEINFKNIILAV